LGFIASYIVVPTDDAQIACYKASYFYLWSK